MAWDTTFDCLHICGVSNYTNFTIPKGLMPSQVINITILPSNISLWEHFVWKCIRTSKVKSWNNDNLVHNITYLVIHINNTLIFSWQYINSAIGWKIDWKSLDLLKINHNPRYSVANLYFIINHMFRFI